jgi:hypothetical protein
MKYVGNISKVSNFEQTAGRSRRHIAGLPSIRVARWAITGRLEMKRPDRYEKEPLLLSKSNILGALATFESSGRELSC